MIVFLVTLTIYFSVTLLGLWIDARLRALERRETQHLLQQQGWRGLRPGITVESFRGTRSENGHFGQLVSPRSVVSLTGRGQSLEESWD